MIDTFVRDILAITETADPNDYMSIFYGNQFVQNETVPSLSILGIHSSFRTSHIPIVEGTLTATVIVGGVPIQNLVATTSNTFVFTDIGQPVTKIVTGSIDCASGTINLTWNNQSFLANAVPMGRKGLPHLVVSYEYTAKTISPSNKERLKVALASYGLACLWDSAVRNEAMKVLEENDKNTAAESSREKIECQVIPS